MEFINDIVKRYGLTVTILLLIIWWLNNRLGDIEKRLVGCEEAKFEIITKNNERSSEVIDRNTLALERNTAVMEALVAPTTAKKRNITAYPARVPY